MGPQAPCGAAAPHGSGERRADGTDALRGVADSSGLGDRSEPQAEGALRLHEAHEPGLALPERDGGGAAGYEGRTRRATSRSRPRTRDPRRLPAEAGHAADLER